MAILVYAEFGKGKVKKSSLEAVSYAAKVASMLGTSVSALIATKESNLADLGKAGANKILKYSGEISHTDSQVVVSLIEQAMSAEGAEIVVLSHDITGKAIAARLAARVGAGIAPGAIDLPAINGSSFVVKKNVFSGKAYAYYNITSPRKVISLLPNSYPVEMNGTEGNISEFSATVPVSKIKIKDVKQKAGEISLPDAEIVVSGGRGMKGPEHWGIIENLAKELGAATACSRPVADMHWRPHHEHVGQTGVAIRPNLYFAIGISGAIQHLAGVNGSKTIVVINKDPEAPFFKAADYGIVGDAFEVLPKLVEAVKKFKANKN